MIPEELEDSVLACMLDPETAQRVALRADLRFFPRRRRLLEAAIEEHRAGERVTVAGWAKRYALASELPWITASREIADMLQHSHGCRENLDRYLEILREEWVLSELRTEGLKLHEALEPTETTERIEALARDLIPQAPSETLRDLLPQAVGDLDHPASQEMRLSTGIGSLDQMLGGGFPNGVITLAARTSMGKSALAMNIATHAVLNGVPTLYVSLEMNSLALVKRCVAHLSQVPMMPSNQLRGPEVEALSLALKELHRAGLNLRFPKPAGHAWTPEWLDAELERAKPLGLVVLDYLTLMQAKGQSRYEELAHILASLRAATARLQCPLLMLAQINRAPEQRSDKRPMLSDLRDSGNIEEVSDLVLLLHRPGYYDRAADQCAAELVIAKNRDGRTGALDLHWRAETTSFFDAGGR